MLLPFLSAAYAFTGRTPFWQASGLGLQFPRTLTPRVKDFRLCKEAPQPTQLLHKCVVCRRTEPAMQVSANAPTNSFFSGKILVLAITQALCPLGKSRPGTFDSSLMAAAPASDVEASMPPLCPPPPSLFQNCGGCYALSALLPITTALLTFSAPARQLRQLSSCR